MKELFHSGQKVEKPWGYELIWAHTERYVGKILHINKGESLSYQYHVVKDETIRLLSGALEMDMEQASVRARRVFAHYSRDEAPHDRNGRLRCLGSVDAGAR